MLCMDIICIVCVCVCVCVCVWSQQQLLATIIGLQIEKTKLQNNIYVDSSDRNNFLYLK